MFQNERFCTCGVNKEVPIVLQCMMWNMVDTMEVESKDYFQVFELSEYDGMQKICLLYTSLYPNLWIWM